MIVGLMVLINVESWRYNEGVDYLPPEVVGAVVKVHSPDIEPLIDQGTITVTPNTENRISIKKVLHWF